MSELEISGSAGAASVAELAAMLVELERALSAERPQLVVLADDSDRCLAGALVATKLVLPIESRAAASETPSANARLIALLAATYTPPA